MVTEIWDRAIDGLRQELGDGDFRNWVAGVAMVAMEGDRAVLEAPTAFTRDWLNNNYQETILRHLQLQAPAINRVEFRARKGARPAARQTEPGTSDGAGGRDEPVGVRLNPGLTFDSFVVGKPNIVAHSAAWRVAHSDATDLNPLFLNGNVGLGKTHLMHAIAGAYIARKPKSKVLYLSAEQFMYRFVLALRDKSILEFKKLFRSVDMLMIDDVQFIADKQSTQEEFFHTFNALVEQRKKVVISADRSPGAIEGIEERIRSRLQSGLVADLHPTSYELRLGILQHKSEASKKSNPGIVFADGLFEFMAKTITSNVRVLEGALNRLIATASFLQADITVELAREVLLDVIQQSDRKIDLDSIIRSVADHYSVRTADLLGPKRTRQFVRPRQVAIYLARQLTSTPLIDIGRKFGGRDHTTVLHSVRTITKLKATDGGIGEDLEILQRRIEG